MRWAASQCFSWGRWNVRCRPRNKIGYQLPQKAGGGVPGRPGGPGRRYDPSLRSHLMVLAWNCEVRRREASGRVDDSVSTEEASLPRSVGKALVPTVRPLRTAREWSGRVACLMLHYERLGRSGCRIGAGHSLGALLPSARLCQAGCCRSRRRLPVWVGRQADDARTAALAIAAVPVSRIAVPARTAVRARLSGAPPFG